MAFDVEYVSTLMPERLIFWMESTDSTMADAARLAAGGCPSGTVVGAEEQTAGQGRLGRKWHSPKEAGLYFSVVLRVALPPEQLPILTMSVGVAVAEAIANSTGLVVDLRWPNDVLVQERKVCGILVQQQHQALVCGIGVNVADLSMPGELAGIATSLEAAGGSAVSREKLLAEILAAVDRHLDLLRQQGKDAVIRAFQQASSFTAGRRVVVDQGERQLRGITDGLDENGFLILWQDDGTRTVIFAGGVRPE